MKPDFTLVAAALLASGINGLDLKAEHAGGMFNRVHSGQYCSDDGVINNGTASGQTVSLGNGKLQSSVNAHRGQPSNNMSRNRICRIPAWSASKGCRTLPHRHLRQCAYQQQTVSTQ
jgi:hypothetical protein